MAKDRFQSLCGVAYKLSSGVGTDTGQTPVDDRDGDTDVVIGLISGVNGGFDAADDSGHEIDACGEKELSLAARTGGLACWCRTLRVVFRRAEGGDAFQVMAKVYRLADRIAAKLGKEPVGRRLVVDLTTGIRELDGVIAWCDALLKQPSPSAKLPEKMKE